MNVNRHFYSRRWEPIHGNFLYKRMLNQEDYQVLKINEPIFGGFHQPQYCVQDYLRYTLSNQNKKDSVMIENHVKALNLIENSVKQYDYDFQVNRHINVFMQRMNQQIGSLVDLSKLDLFIKSQNELTVIIIPFLRREANLRDLLMNLHSFLQRQYIQYRIIVAEQANSDDKFNKGRLYNAAFQFIHEMYDWGHDKAEDDFYPESKSNYEEIRKNYHGIKLKIDCITMHDVDLIPESDLNFYKCQDSPRHHSIKIRHFGNERVVNEYEQSPYELLIGGVLTMRPSVYRLINGFSNEYWNWGAEDDGNILYF